jgi:hypothetical protein
MVSFVITSSLSSGVGQDMYSNSPNVGAYHESSKDDIPAEDELRKKLQLPPKERVPRVESHALIIGTAIRHYREVFDHIPDYPHRLVAALRGQNEKHIVFIDWEDDKISDEGFLDPWGTPYLLSIESNVLVVISCGSNHVLGDDDDVVKRIRLDSR